MILNAMPDTPFPENSRRQQEKTSGVTYLHTNDPFAGKAEPATIDSSHPGQHSLMVLINAQFTFHDWKKKCPPNKRVTKLLTKLTSPEHP